MRLILFRAAARMLVRCATASAVRLALGALLSTPHPAIALPSAVDIAVVQSVAATEAGNGGACDPQAAGADLTGAVGPGWG